MIFLILTLKKKKQGSQHFLKLNRNRDILTQTRRLLIISFSNLISFKKLILMQDINPFLTNFNIHAKLVFQYKIVTKLCIFGKRVPNKSINAVENWRHMGHQDQDRNLLWWSSYGQDLQANNSPSSSP